MNKLKILLTIILNIILIICSDSEELKSNTTSTSTILSKNTKKEFSKLNQDKVEIRTFLSTSSFSAPVHVIHSAKGNIIVDPGHYSNELASYVKSIGGLDAVLLTHGHFPNIQAVDIVKANNPDVKIFIHKLDRNFLQDSRLNCSDISGFSLYINSEPLVFEEGIINIEGYKIEIIHLPGHTAGSSVFYFEEENLLFGGDTIMANKVGSSIHPTGNELDRKNSINKFNIRKFPDNMRVFSGHGDSTIYINLMKTNTDLIKGAKL